MPLTRIRGWRLQFGLRTALLTMLFVALAFGWLGNQRHQFAVEQQLVSQMTHVEPEPPVPTTPGLARLVLDYR